MWPHSRHTAPGHSDGFALLEAVISAGLLIVLVAGLGPLLVMSSVAARASADASTALFLAVQKIEQLRGLTWTYDRDGREVSDFTTRLAVDPPGADGRGLRPSPPDSLQRDVDGFVDFLDRQSQWLGATFPPRGASFIRRWSIRRLDAANDDLLLLQVVVMHVSVAERIGSTSSLQPNDPGVVWLTTLKGRR